MHNLKEFLEEKEDNERVLKPEKNLSEKCKAENFF